MKKLFLFAICFFGIGILNAQNWQLAKSSKVQWFIGNNNYLKVIFVDSVKAINGDSIFYFPVTLGGKAKNFFYPKDAAVNLKSPWWIGDKMVLRPDGTQLFFSAENDTLFFYPNKAENDEWIMANYKSGKYLKAKIKAAYTDTVLGVTDSIKVIQLQMYSKINVPITHALNSQEIRISKNSGFINIFPLFSALDTITDLKYEAGTHKYDLAPYKLTNIGKRLTKKDVFGFNKGDIFEIRSFFYGPIIRKEINDKYEQGDSIKYATKSAYGYYYMTYRLDSIIQKDEWILHDGSLFNKYYPEQYNIVPYSSGFYPYWQGMREYFYYVNSCGLITITNKNQPTMISNDTLYYHFFESWSNYTIYGEHLGLMDSTQDWPNGDARDNFEFRLDYSKNKYCNIGLFPFGIKSSAMVNPFKIFPNPSATEFNLSGEVPVRSIKIFNSIGKEVLYQECSHEFVVLTINVSDFAPGLYFVFVNRDFTLPFLKTAQ